MSSARRSDRDGGALVWEGGRVHRDLRLMWIDRISSLLSSGD